MIYESCWNLKRRNKALHGSYAGYAIDSQIREHIKNIATTGGLDALTKEVHALTQADQGLSVSYNDLAETTDINSLLANNSQITELARELHSQLQALDFNKINTTVIPANLSQVIELSNHIEIVRELKESDPSESNRVMYEEAQISFALEVKNLSGEPYKEGIGISQLEQMKNLIEDLPVKVAPIEFSSERANIDLSSFEFGSPNTYQY